MKRFLTPLFFLSLLIATIFSGCANSNHIISTGLEVEVTGIERSADGTVAVAWQVKNSNIVSYLLSRVNHRVQLNGTLLGVIEENEPLALPANRNGGRTSKLTSLDAAATRAVNEAISAGSGNYRVDTQITVLVYDDSKEKSVLSNFGTVPVKGK